MTAKKTARQKDQDNIGYENTTTRNSGDEQPNEQPEDIDPARDRGKSPNPDPENSGDTYQDNSGGLRAESSAKGVSGSTDKGKSIKSGKVDTKGKKKGKQ